jgi:hypothetical protein
LKLYLWPEKLLEALSLAGKTAAIRSTAPQQTRQEDASMLACIVCLELFICFSDICLGWSLRPCSRSSGEHQQQEDSLLCLRAAFGFSVACGRLAESSYFV